MECGAYRARGEHLRNVHFFLERGMNILHAMGHVYGYYSLENAWDHVGKACLNSLGHISRVERARDEEGSSFP